MKTRIILLSFIFLLIAGNSFAQRKNAPKSIISDHVAIAKYHDKDELDRMQKGELLGLYIERINVLVKILPYIAFTTKPGVTMTDLGIPDTSDNRKALDTQIEGTNEFLVSTMQFQRQMLPYSDTSNLVAAILFYEETLKSLHEYSQYH